MQEQRNCSKAYDLGNQELKCLAKLAITGSDLFTALESLGSLPFLLNQRCDLYTLQYIPYASL